MARNLFTSALLGGLAGFASGRAQEIAAAEEHQRRLQLQEKSQENMLERMGARMGGAGGSGGSGGARVSSPPLSASQVVQDVNTIMAAPTEAEVRAAYPNAPEVMAPGYAPSNDPNHMNDSGDARPVLGPDGQPLAAGQKPPMRLDPAFMQEKSREIVRYRKLMMAGPNADDLAKGEQAMAETSILESAAKGDRKSGEALLLNKGKDPLETTARAEAQEAEADKDRRTDPNLRKGSGGGVGSPRTPADKTLAQLTQQRIALDADLNRLTRALQNASSRDRVDLQTKISAAEAQKAGIVARIGQLEKGYQPGQPAAQSPAAPAPPRRSQFTVIR